ncbi:TlpA family protein disulfide reductase [Glaciimonas immobilis]|uniref:Peroxiredoxin n=1 Tax=Glaciimonas immobilis TaxID=728004 RepID=A0A840RQL0_9BURK|nr:TlpA disulfide reductase family protein [Glaciimonas immobilis]KAF3997174.1 TlpA family protein disulfide reductase [Glaciimonas immobilis]MBB5200045.1 peroxiredoxin [Glaciimonas immobilis]
MQSQVDAAPRKSLWIKLGIAVVVVATGLFFALSFAHKNPAPDVSFTNLQGEKISLKSLRGKVVMVNFWATSCTTCVGEMPKMIATYDKYKAQGLDFVAVAMSYDPPNYVVNFVKTRALPFQVALDTNEKIANAFGDVKLTPTTFVIDKQGNIIKRYVGEPSFDELHQLLDKALAA